MAKLKSIFLKGIETIFNVFDEAVKSGIFEQNTDDGFGNSSIITDDIRCIFEKFSSKDLDLLSFASSIQPNDIKGLMPCGDIIDCEVNTRATVLFGSDRYTVEGFELDPMEVIYTLLLRKV